MNRIRLKEENILPWIKAFGNIAGSCKAIMIVTVPGS